VDRLRRKWDTAALLVPDPVIQQARKPANWGIVSVGSCDSAVLEAIDRLADKGIHVDYCRVKAFPFTAKVTRFLAEHERLFVVEQNRDAQLKSLLILETDCPKEKLQSVLHYGGLPIDCRCIVEAVEQAAAKGVAA
jgi:2-oxoglutarate ferredoxin oxidoreductase subunit alpha